MLGAKPDAVLVTAPGGPSVLPQTTLYDMGYKGQMYQTHGAALPDFLTDTYAAFDECRDHIPSNAYAMLRRMRAGGWLSSYGDVEGVRTTLQRMSQRLRRPFDLAAATAELERNYDALHQDFAEFFPQAVARFKSPMIAH